MSTNTNIVRQQESINTMSSVNDLVVKEFIEETPFMSTNNDDQHEINTTNYSTNEILEKDFIQKTSLSSFKNIVNQQKNTTKILPITDFCRILPTPVCKNNLLCMRHERTCHVFKGFIGKCKVCGERFTTSKLICLYGML